MTDVSVRETTVEDVPEIRNVARRGWTAAYGDFLAEATIEHAMDEWYASETVRGQVEREEIAHFVAAGNGEIVGYVGGGISDGESGAVWTFYVDPSRWDEGIGTRLFEHELDALRERGVTRVTIRVLAENAVGRSFYESRGFEVIEESEDDLFGEQQPAVTYAGDI